MLDNAVGTFYRRDKFRVFVRKFGTNAKHHQSDDKCRHLDLNNLSLPINAQTDNTIRTDYKEKVLTLVISRCALQRYLLSWQSSFALVQVAIAEPID